MPTDIASLGIKVDSREVKHASTDLDKLTKAGGKTEKSVKSLTSSSHLLQKALAAVSVAVVVSGFVSIGKASLQAASDLEETQGKFDVVFRNMTATSEAWAKTLQDSYIMAEEESKRYLSSLQDLLVPTGLARKEAGAMAFEFVKLAGDLASFNNLPTGQVIRDIQSALAGGSETMTKYGIDVKVAAIKQEALNLGLIKGKEIMTKQARAQALLSLAYKDSADAVGDLTRTSGSYANQVKRFQADMSDLRTEIGEGLLPIVRGLLIDFNKWYKINEKIIQQDLKQWAETTADVLKVLAISAKWVLDVFVGFDAWLAGKATIAPRVQAMQDLIAEYDNLSIKLENLRNLQASGVNVFGADAEIKELEQNINRVTGALDAMQIKQTNAFAITLPALQSEIDLNKKVKDGIDVIGDAAENAGQEIAKVIHLSKRANWELVQAGKDRNIQLEHFEVTQKKVKKTAQEINEETELLARRWIDAAKASDNLWEGFQAGVMDSIENTKTLGQVGFEVFQTFRGGIKDTFSSAFRGEFDEIGDVWESTLDRMLDSAIDMASEAATNFVIEEGLDFVFGSGTASSFGFGGGALVTDGAMHVKVVGGVGGIGTSGRDSAGIWNGGTSSIIDNGFRWVTQAAALGDMFTSLNAGDVITYGRQVEQYASVMDEFYGYTEDATEAASTWGNITNAATDVWETVKPYVGIAAGAASIYGGIQGLRSGDTVGGALQTVGGISQMYQGAVAADFIDSIPIMDTAGRIIGLVGNAYGTYAGIRNILDNGATVGNLVSTASSAYGTVTGAASAYTAATAASTGAASTGVIANIGAGSAYAMPIAVGVAVAAGMIDAVWGSKGYSEKFYQSPTYGQIRVEEYGELGPQGSLYQSLRGDFDTMKQSLIEPSSDEASRNFIENLERSERTMAGFGDSIMGHLEVLAIEFDDVFAQMALAVEPTIDSFDAFIEEITGVEVSTAKATEIHKLVDDASRGSADSLNLLVGNLADLGMESGVANVAAASMVASFQDVTFSMEEMLHGYTEEANDAINAGEDVADIFSLLSSKMLDLGYSVGETESYIQSLMKSLAITTAVQTDMASAVANNFAFSTQASALSDNFATGGFLQGGSGIRDDLYLGKVNGRVQVAMGGEHIMPPEQSKKYARELELMRADKYLMGGFIGLPAVIGTAAREREEQAAREQAARDYSYTGIASAVPGTPEKNLDRISSIIKNFNNVLASDALIKYADDVRKINVSYDDSIKTLMELGAAQEDIDKAEATRAVALRVIEEKRKDDLESLISPYEQLSSNMSQSVIWLENLSDKYNESVEKAIELGASEQQLNIIRNAQQQEVENQIDSIMASFETTIATSSLSDYEKSLYNINTQYDESIEQLRVLGASQTDLQQVEHARLIEIEKLTNATEGSFTNIADVLKDVQRFSVQGSVTGSGSIVGHASGGIAISTHVIGEGARPEALMPLHAGPDTIKYMDQKLDALLQAPPVINVAVFIGNEEFDGRIKVVANNEIYKRERRQIKGQSYFKRIT